MKKVFAFVLSGWLCSIAFAQMNPAAPTPNAPQSAPVLTGNAGNKNAVYADRIPPEQMITLDASGDKFQARHIPDLSGEPRGAVIILHDSGQHPSWPFTAAALIDDLPLHGWDTLNIELPAPAIDEVKKETPSTAPTAAATAPASNSPPATNSTAPATTPNIESQTQARISAAIKYYADQNQRNIVLIGFGSGAIRAAENLRSIITATPNQTAPLTALVMIAPQQKLNGIELDLPKLLPLTGIAALDMVLDNDVQARAEAEARRRAVLHQRTRVYTRLELPPLNNTSDAQHSTMVKRVRSWLQKNAFTMEKAAK
jgi:dienelactone hydrolase